LVTGTPIVHSPVSVEPVRGGTETILLAEDEAGIRTMTRTFLEGLGYRVIEARDGREAVRKSRTYKDIIHLIVTDVLMPGIRGDAAIRLIRKGRPEVLAIYISGYHQQDETRSELENILYKPFEFPELGRKIRTLLDANTDRQGIRKRA
jgi:CheY-like chemotaxis protein